MKVWVPRDAAAKALGADAVAAAFEAAGAEVVRNGSRGMIWLEPLVEVERDGVRVGYGAAAPADVSAILDGSADSVGPVEQIPFYAKQNRLTFQRCGVIDPLSLAEYEAHGGLVGLRRAIEMSDADIRAYVIADNRLAENAGWDDALLAAEFQYLQDLEIDFDLTLTGFELPEIDFTIQQITMPGSDPPEDDAIPAVCRPGPCRG